MDSIFFDEAVAEYNDTTAKYMNSIASYARNALGAARDIIVFNPSEQATTECYSIADYVVAFENSYSAYSASVLSSISTEIRAQSQFIVYSFTSDETSQTTLADDLAAGDIGGIFVTTHPDYTAFSLMWTTSVWLLVLHGKYDEFRTCRYLRRANILTSRDLFISS